MNIKQSIKIIILGLVMSLGVSYISAAWSKPPTGTPPACPSDYPGCDAPIHAGKILQSKLGPLQLNTSLDDPNSWGLKVFGTGIFYGGIQLPEGAEDGKVLVSDADGNASWGDSSLNSLSGVANISCDSYGDVPLNQRIEFPEGVEMFPPPKIFITPKWANYSGDEAPSFWVTNVTTTGFNINIHTTGKNRCKGESGIYWIAIN